MRLRAAIPCCALLLSLSFLLPASRAYPLCTDASQFPFLHFPTELNSAASLSLCTLPSLCRAAGGAQHHAQILRLLHRRHHQLLRCPSRRRAAQAVRRHERLRRGLLRCTHVRPLRGTLFIYPLEPLRTCSTLCLPRCVLYGFSLQFLLLLRTKLSYVGESIYYTPKRFNFSCCSY